MAHVQNIASLSQISHLYFVSYTQRIKREPQDYLWQSNLPPMSEMCEEESHQRMALSFALEPGHQYWSRQIAEFGVRTIYEHLYLGVYDHEKFARVISKVKEFNCDEALHAALEASSVYITPSDPLWPVQLNDLDAPPIGMYVKGTVEALKNRSIAIVGSRNPTPYGTRIAGDFAAGFVDREWGHRQRRCIWN